MQETKIILTLLNGIGFLALVSVGYGAVQRLQVSPLLRSLANGLLFGLGALVAMMSPAILIGGSHVDARSIFVGLAAAFAGPLAGIIAAGIAGAFRFWQGGPGAVLGLSMLAIALAAGVLWRYFWLHRRAVTPLGLFVLGFGIAAQVLVLLLIPTTLTTPTALATFVIAITASALFATLVIGGVMERENRQIARERSLSEYAYSDPLTGLGNRRSLDNAKERILGLSRRKGFCVLLLDIDHFKSVNDRHGHHVGDIALCLIADILKADARLQDVAVRFGGEEFLVLLPATTGEEGEAVAERIRAKVQERPVRLTHDAFNLTVSIGLAHQRGSNVDAAITRADDALYAAKAGGRNRVFRAPSQGTPADPSARPSREGASSPRFSERAT